MSIFLYIFIGVSIYLFAFFLVWLSCFISAKITFRKVKNKLNFLFSGVKCGKSIVRFRSEYSIDEIDDNSVKKE